MVAKKNEVEAIDECYRILYENSTPKGDWSKLKLRTDQFFFNYKISGEFCDKIMDDMIKKHKIKPKYRQQLFRNSILLGSSPVFDL